MTLPEDTVKRIILHLLKGEDYRIEILKQINSDFLHGVVAFLRQAAHAKSDRQASDSDWYKTALIDNDALTKKDLIQNAGLNEKTISNMHNSSTKAISIQAAKENHEQLRELIEQLLKEEAPVDIKLTVDLDSTSVAFTASESLLVINALAVKRAALRGGLWSAAGKGVERPLMETLCRLYQVPSENYAEKTPRTRNRTEREVDFYLRNKRQKEYKCEVKLMGKGNPESADAVYARGTNIFIADKLSDAVIRQLEAENIKWVELRGDLGYQRFAQILEELDIPHQLPQKQDDATLLKVIDAACRSSKP